MEQQAIDHPVEGSVTPQVQSAIIQEEIAPVVTQQPVQTDSMWDTFEAPEGLELSPKDTEFKSLPDYVKHVHGLRKMAAEKGGIPADDADPEVRSQFNQQLADAGYKLQQAPEQYAVEMIENTEGMTDERKAGIYEGFRGLSLDADQAEGVMKLYADQIAKDAEESQANAAKEYDSTLAKLREEAGDKADTRIAGIERIQAQHPEAMELLKQFGLHGQEAIVRMLDAVATGTREDVVDQDLNPSGGLSDIDAQIKALKADPLYRNGAMGDPRRTELQNKIESLYVKRQQFSS